GRFLAFWVNHAGWPQDPDRRRRRGAPPVARRAAAACRRVRLHRSRQRRVGADAGRDRPLRRDPARCRPAGHGRPRRLPRNAAARKRVRLTEKETAILKYLYRAGDRAIGRDTLLGEVWGYNAGVTTHTLETHVYRLRQKIERDPARAEILITEPGGYRLMP